jgi:hypothetical protein
MQYSTYSCFHDFFLRFLHTCFMKRGVQTIRKQHEIFHFFCKLKELAWDALGGSYLIFHQKTLCKVRQLDFQTEKFSNFVTL